MPLNIYPHTFQDAVFRKEANFFFEKKVFIVLGPFKEVRDALLRRGWCENSTKNSYLFDLKWTLYDNEVVYDAV